MKVSELIEILKDLEQDSEVLVHLVRDGWRPFTSMKEIKSLESVFEQDTGKLIYSLTVEIDEKESK